MEIRRRYPRNDERVKLTRRGELVLFIGVLALALLVITKVASSLWYVGEGEGYCWGSYEKCYQLEGEKK